MNADDEKLVVWLESREFYELCQNYRHARDASKLPDERDNALQAFERLKREIRGHADYSAGRRAGMTEAAGVVRGGRFLHEEAPVAKWAKECAAAIEKARDK